MGRTSDGPWYRKAKGTWYATVDGKSVSLGVKGKDKKREAATQWHRLVVSGDGLPVAPQPVPAAKQCVTVAVLIREYTADAKSRVKPQTVVWVRQRLASFDRRFGKRPAEDITPHEAESSARRSDWGANTRRHYLAVVTSAYRWATRVRLIASNPLQGIRLPPAASRGAKAVISEAEHARLLAHARPAFRPLLQGLWLTGCRPGELAGLRAADVDFNAGVAVLTTHKTAGKTGRPRVLYRSADAVALLRRLAIERPVGPLFVNRYRLAWKPDAICEAMQATCARAGLPGKHAYGYRHSYATQALVAGIPDAQVAALLGHSDTAMLHKHYSHLTSRADVLRQAAARVR